MSFTANNANGEYKHTLTVGELARHSHEEIFIASGYPGWEKYTTKYYSFMPSYHLEGYFYPGQETTIATNIKANQYTGYNGDNTPHNNIQPYITVFFWKRIS